MVDLTSVVTSGVAESYGESIGAEVWDEGMTRLATLMALENLRLPSSVAHAAAGDPGMGSSKTASEIAEMLDLKPHPEGGFYSETFRDFSITLVKSQLPPHCKTSSQIPPSFIMDVLVWSPPVHVLVFASQSASDSKNKHRFSSRGSFKLALTDKVDRPVSTSIYFLLPSGSVSHLHRIPCAETWHFYSGEPLTVTKLYPALAYAAYYLDAGHRPQYTVPPNVWFGSFPTLDVASFASDGSLLVKSPKRDPESHYSLVGCTCAPAFQFEDFELAKLADLKPLSPRAEPFLDYLNTCFFSPSDGTHTLFPVNGCRAKDLDFFRVVVLRGYFLVFIDETSELDQSFLSAIGYLGGSLMVERLGLLGQVEEFRLCLTSEERLLKRLSFLP
ncbi:hypothetical protein GW17_00022652 [Ensete ventricosum]|nr:hypothetical protein GW17_00022652 [Ensete ventricosum]